MLDERRRRLREQDLPTVGEIRDARRQVDCEADIAVGAERGLARVDADAGPRLGGERLLRLHGGRHRPARARKGEEDRVWPAVDRLASVLCEDS